MDSNVREVLAAQNYEYNEDWMSSSRAVCMTTFDRKGNLRKPVVKMLKALSTAMWSLEDGWLVSRLASYRRVNRVYGTLDQGYSANIFKYGLIGQGYIKHTRMTGTYKVQLGLMRKVIPNIKELVLARQAEYERINLPATASIILQVYTPWAVRRFETLRQITHACRLAHEFADRHYYYGTPVVQFGSINELEAWLDAHDAPPHHGGASKFRGRYVYNQKLLDIIPEGIKLPENGHELRERGQEQHNCIGGYAWTYATPTTETRNYQPLLMWTDKVSWEYRLDYKKRNVALIQVREKYNRLTEDRNLLDTIEQIRKNILRVIKANPGVELLSREEI